MTTAINNGKQEVLLFGLFDARPKPGDQDQERPDAGQAAATVRRIGAGRADSMALLLIARYAEDLEEGDLRQLGLIAAGGGRVSEGLRVQAAWLYLKHSDSIEPALSRIFDENP